MIPPANRLNMRFANRVAYVASHSFPYSSNGYAVRTHAVAKALGARGHEVIVFNRPGRPWDIEGFSSRATVQAEQIIDGVRYVFLPTDSQPRDNRRTRLREAERVLLEAFEVFRPGTVVGVSNWENAEPAQNAARRFGAGFFYEQRGFWEMGRTGPDATPEELEDAQNDRQNETSIATAALAVFTLNESMRRELITRGVPSEKIHLVPNGVSAADPTAKSVSRGTLGIKAKHLLSYVGSLSPYEGVDDLVRLIAHLRKEGVDADAMIVGSSAPKGLIDSDVNDQQEQMLRALTRALDLTAHVHFIPQVSYAKVGAYYAISDAVILPRRRSVMTDIPLLHDVARDIHGTLFPEGDITALAGMLEPVFDRTHPALSEPVSAAVQWPRRVRPMSDLLAEEARRAQRDMDANMPSGGSLSGGMASGQRFDPGAIPMLALNPPVSRGSTVCLGPGANLKPDAEGADVLYPNRQTLLGVLATEPPGTFYIDWTGLQNLTTPHEWRGLWSIDNMRLNRQIMDACRVALDRGWQIRVLGPLHRSQAPLFRTVAEAVEIINPEAQP